MVVRERPTQLAFPASVRKSPQHRVQNGIQAPHIEKEHLERPAGKNGGYLNYHLQTHTCFKNSFVSEEYRIINYLFTVKRTMPLSCPQLPSSTPIPASQSFGPSPPPALPVHPSHPLVPHSGTPPQSIRLLSGLRAHSPSRKRSSKTQSLPGRTAST